jgi:AAA15 family ATPase/GTPase
MTGQIVDLLNKNPELKKKTINFMRNCDFAIRGIEFVDAPPIPEEILNSMPFNDEIKKMFANSPSVAIKTVHAVRDAERTVVDTCYFDLLGQESMGTRKFFEMTVPILYALDNGTTLYYDEFGSYIHPALAKAIIELLKSSDNNKGASLILNTHSTSIMANAGLDRDEIIFIQKGLSEESIISPLNERAVRANESFEKRYREGLYGAVPVIRERA